MLFRGLARLAVASSFGLAAGCAQHSLEGPQDNGGSGGAMDASTESPAGMGGGEGGTGGRGGAGGIVENTGGTSGAGGGIPDNDGGRTLEDAGQDDEWHPVPCANGAPVLTDVSSFVRPVDFVGRYAFDRPREGFGEPLFNDAGIWPASLTERVLFGSACAGASDPSACNAAFEAQKPTVGACENEGDCGPALIFTGGDEATRIEERAALVALLGGTIDTEQEAMLALILEGHDVACYSGAGSLLNAGYRIRATEGGYEAQRFDDCGGDGYYTYDIAPDGTVEYGQTVGDVCVAGRKPAGLRRTASCAEASELGAYFASAAHLEAASVHAFARIADELRALGAPDELVAAAWQSARDEIAHTHAMAALAARFGGAVEAPEVAAAQPRDAFAFALENAIEGCVRETYGALLACYQAEAAADRTVKDAMAVIADDETRHAQLAWRIAEWLEPQLDAEQRAALACARRTAFAALRRELATAMSPAARAVIGAPDAAASLALLDQLGAALALHG